MLPGDVALETARSVETDSKLVVPTMVQPGDDLFDDMASLKIGGEVRVSGEFLPRADRDQCAGTSNIMYFDDMQSPDFSVRITSIEPV